MMIRKLEPLPPPEEQSEFLKRLVKAAHELSESPERKLLIENRKAYEEKRRRLIDEAKKGGVTATMI